MSRQHIDYTARQERAPATGFDVDVPAPGFYRMRLVSGGVFVGVQILFGPPRDPDTGEELDRSHRWQARVNGADYPLERVWPKCAREPISATEYAYLSSLQEWGKAHAPQSPQANPTRSIDLLSAPLPF